MHRDSRISTIDQKNIPGLWNRLEATLGANEIAFLERVYANGLAKYERRLAAIGFEKKEHVLDAGCGMGQWTLSLSGLCRHVTGIDVSDARVRACQRIAESVGVKNISWVAGQLEALPFEDKWFDGVVCYSVLYLTDYRQVIQEFSRILQPGGLLYLSANGVGRSLYDLIKRPNPAADFDPRRYGLLTLWNTVMQKRSGFSIRNGAVAMSRRKTVHLLEAAGFDVVTSGPEGCAAFPNESFASGRFLGLENVFEVLATRR
jgi:SAM-dependent methyltransferase